PLDFLPLQTIDYGMFTLCVKDSFAAAHRLVGYKGKCEELHGHNFTVEVFISGDRLADDGMLVDFQTIKGHLQNVLDVLDHKYINDIPFFNERASSAEYIAMYIFTEMEKRMGQDPVSVREVRVWESERAYASYER
ncbi:MAG TPA: 6-carboxytetrahydropterin synthase QueD, partial [Deltaproteobacteria bacterium]|nr:6-carboxytetrahydropterin synthase QueD [Deltaproteobacteria bacterium]